MRDAEGRLQCSRRPRRPDSFYRRVRPTARGPDARGEPSDSRRRSGGSRGAFASGRTVAFVLISRRIGAVGVPSVYDSDEGTVPGSIGGTTSITYGLSNYAPRRLTSLGFVDGPGFRRIRLLNRRRPALGESEIEQHRLAKAGDDYSLMRERVSGLGGMPEWARVLNQSHCLQALQLSGKLSGGHSAEGLEKFLETNRLLEVDDGQDFDESVHKVVLRNRNVPPDRLLIGEFDRPARPEVDVPRELETSLREDGEPFREVSEDFLVFRRGEDCGHPRARGGAHGSPHRLQHTKGSRTH